MLYRKRTSMRRKSYRELKKELLGDNEIKKAYEKFWPEFTVIEIIIKKRIEKGF